MVNTSLGFASPYVYVISLLVIAGICEAIYVIWKGNKMINEGEAGKPFLSGEDIQDFIKYARIEGENTMWGLKKGWGKYIEALKRGHSGLVNMYVFWLVIVGAITMLILVIV